MQLIKPKSETLYYENCFCSESIGTSFYNFFTTVDMAYCDWWIIKVVPVVYPIECDIALITASHPFVLDKNYYSYLFDFKLFANELMVSWLLLLCIFAMMCLFVMFRTFRFDKLIWHAS